MESGNPGLTAKKWKFIALECIVQLQQNTPFPFII